MTDRLTLTRARIEKLCAGLVRYSESDASFAPCVAPGDAALDEPEPLLRAAGLLHDTTRDEFDALLAPSGDGAAALRDALARFETPRFARVWHPADVWNAMPCVTVATDDGAVALVARMDVDRSEFAAESWLAPSGEPGGPRAQEAASALARATDALFLGEAFRPEAPAWAVQTGATPRAALGRAACAAGLLRRRAFRPFRRQGETDPAYAKLNEYLAALRDVTAWYLGWRASYAELVLGRTGHDDWAGVLTHVTWT